MASSDNTAPNTSLADRYPNAYKDFYPNGPACIYKTGPAWPERFEDPQGFHSYPLGRDPRPVYNHPITASWLSIGERIFKRLDVLQVPWSSINPLAYADVGEAKPFCPLLISIGVTPKSLPYDAACAAAHDSKGILVEAGFPGIEIAFVESTTTRHCGTSSNFLSFDDLLSPGVDSLVRPFTTLLGIPISPLEHPNLVGTGGLIFCLGKDSNKKPIIGLLTCAHVALPHDVYGADYKRGRSMDEILAPIEYIALGEAGYQEAVEKMGDFIRTEHLSIEVWTSALEKEAAIADREKGQLGQDHGKRRKAVEMKIALVDLAQKKIERVEELRAEVIENRATPHQRLLGSLLYSAPLQVSTPERFTSDWAMIAVNQDKLNQSLFAGNKVYIGDSLGRRDFNKLLYPQDANDINFDMYPRDGLLQVAGAVGEAEIRSPKTLDEHGEPCLFAVKNGASSGTTVGRVNGIQSFVRTFAGGDAITTREIAVVGCRRGANRVIDSFSAEGDSGAVVVTGDGRIVGIINGGKPGPTDRSDISFITPYWWLECQIKEKFPDCYLYEGV